MIATAPPPVLPGSSAKVAAPSCPAGSPRWRSGALPTYRVAEIVAPPVELPVFSDGWKARCRTCRHLDLIVQPLGNEVMRCSRYRRSIGWRGRVTIAGYCIDARDDGPCGLDATLWEAR